MYKTKLRPYRIIPNIILGFRLNFMLCSIIEIGAPLADPSFIKIKPKEVASTYAIISNVDITIIIDQVVWKKKLYWTTDYGRRLL